MPHSLPPRIQCRRDRPWQTTPKAIYVGRPSRWGNPYRVGVHGTAEECVRLFETRYGNNATYRAAVRAELAGKSLACWCKVGQSCHADVLLRWANAPAEC
jgi:hypothetical protein